MGGLLGRSAPCNHCQVTKSKQSRPPCMTSPFTNRHKDCQIDAFEQQHKVWNRKVGLGVTSKQGNISGMVGGSKPRITPAKNTPAVTVENTQLNILQAQQKFWIRRHHHGNARTATAKQMLVSKLSYLKYMTIQGCVKINNSRGTTTEGMKKPEGICCFVAVWSWCGAMQNVTLKIPDSGSAGTVTVDFYTV